MEDYLNEQPDDEIQKICPRTNEFEDACKCGQCLWERDNEDFCPHTGELKEDCECGDCEEK